MYGSQHPALQGHPFFPVVDTVISQHPHDNLSDYVEVLSGVSHSLQAAVLVEDDIQLPVHALDAPVFADTLRHLLCAVKLVGGDEVARVGRLCPCLLDNLSGLHPHDLVKIQPPVLAQYAGQIAVQHILALLYPSVSDVRRRYDTVWGDRPYSVLDLLHQ